MCRRPRARLMLVGFLLCARDVHVIPGPAAYLDMENQCVPAFMFFPPSVPTPIINNQYVSAFVFFFSSVPTPTERRAKAGGGTWATCTRWPTSSTRRSRASTPTLLHQVRVRILFRVVYTCSFVAKRW